MLGFSASVYAQGGSIYGQVVSPAGYPVAFASVRICPTTSTGTPCTPLAANLWSDPQMTQPVANPYTTDGFGNFSVFVPPATYYIVQVSFISNQQPYTYAYIEAAASNAVATAAPQYTIPIYTAPGTATTLGEGFVSGNGQLRSDAAGGLYVPGPAIFYGTLAGTSITGTVINTTSIFEVNGTQIAAANLLNGVTGSGAIVLANTPTLITPILGVASATSLNTSGNIVDGGTLAVTGNATAPIFNAATGYQLGGAAPLNHILLGNGTNYVDATSVPASALPTFYYQTVAANAATQTQRPVLNFASRFTVTDSASPAETTVDLPTTVTAGSCVRCSITVDAYGRTTALSTGVSPGIDQWITFTSCVPANDGDNEICQGGPISWPISFADTSYFIDSCMVDDSSTYTNSPPPTAFVQVHLKTAGGFSYTLTDVKGSSAAFPYSWPVTCHGHHA